MYNRTHAAFLSRAHLEPEADIGAAVGGCTLLPALVRAEAKALLDPAGMYIVTMAAKMKYL